MDLRNKIYKFIESDGSKSIYDFAMIAIIIISLIPLCFKESTPILYTIDCAATIIFIIDYFFRWCTADYKLKKGKYSFLIYPFTFMAIIDLLSILPFFLPIAQAVRALKVIRLLKSFKVFRAFKIARYSRSMRIISAVIKAQATSLLAVCTFAVAYVFIFALIVFNIEPDTFNSFFDAIYWATISLTTVGYGDIYPVSTLGRVMSMISSFVGVAIVALPAGIVTAGYMEEIKKEKENGNKI